MSTLDDQYHPADLQVPQDILRRLAAASWALCILFVLEGWPCRTQNDTDPERARFSGWIPRISLGTVVGYWQRDGIQGGGDLGPCGRISDFGGVVEQGVELRKDPATSIRRGKPFGAASWRLGAVYTDEVVGICTSHGMPVNAWWFGNIQPRFLLMHVRILGYVFLQEI